MAFREMAYGEVINFIPPIKTNLNFKSTDLKNFLDDKDYQELRINIVDIYSKLIDNIIPSLKKSKFNLSTVTYTSHKDGYDFRLNPIDFINNIFKELNYDIEIPYIDLDDKLGMACFDDYVYKYTNQIINSSDDINNIEIMQSIKDNLKDINGLYKYDINDYIKEKSIPKDVLFYLSYLSLKEYVETDNSIYTVMPYKYYHKVSDMQNYSFPHMIVFSGDYNKKWFTDFRGKYKILLGEDYKPNIDDYLLRPESIVVGYDILRPGMVDKEIHEAVLRTRANPNVDYDKYIDLFNKKIKFYKESPYIHQIVGKYGLNGYIGFTYPNEYLLFDKLYNSDTIDPTKRTILTSGAAAYALPSDRFGIIGKTKQDIIAAKSLDERIKKFNHTDTYIERVKPVIYGPNVSLTTFEEELEKEKTKILINGI